MLDIAAMGEAAAAYRIPIEINGGTHFRLRSSNQPFLLKLLWQAYRQLMAGKATFVPGSDQHGFLTPIGRIGMYVPADCFEMLGLTVEDIPFLEQLPGACIILKSRR